MASARCIALSRHQLAAARAAFALPAVTIAGFGQIQWKSGFLSKGPKTETIVGDDS
jgi:hypothetical protein